MKREYMNSDKAQLKKNKVTTLLSEVGCGTNMPSKLTFYKINRNTGEQIFFIFCCMGFLTDSMQFLVADFKSATSFVLHALVFMQLAFLILSY